MIAYINITNRCNLLCKMCDVGQREKQNTFGRAIGKELTPEQWLALIQKVGASEVVINAVEPLLYERLNELVELLKPRVLRLTTNGWLLEEKFDTVRRFDHVAVSLDGTESLHDNIRGRKGSFRRAFHGLIKLKEAGVPVRVSYAITPDNTHCIEIFVNSMRVLGIPVVFNHFNFVHPEIAERYGLQPYNTKVYDPKDVNIQDIIDVVGRPGISWQPHLTTIEELRAYYQDVPVRNTKYNRCNVFEQILKGQRCTIAADGTFLTGNRCWVDDVSKVGEMVSDFRVKGLPEPCHRLCCGGKTV